MLQNNSKIKSLIEKLWNNFWSGGIANPLTAIEQITYLIFMKRLDDLETKRERDAEFTGEKYTHHDLAVNLKHPEVMKKWIKMNCVGVILNVDLPMKCYYTCKPKSFHF